MDLLNSCFETTNEVRQLALYSHLLPIFVSITLAYFVHKLSHESLQSKLFGLFALLLSTWLIGDLITWHSNNYYAVAAFWSTLDFINILFYLVLVAFFYVVYQKRTSLHAGMVAALILIAIPPLLITVSGISVWEFDETNCEMAGNGLLAQYKLAVEWLSIITISLIGFYALFKNRSNKQVAKSALVLTLSSIVFLALFSGSEYLATLTNVYEITLYALFSLPIFLAIITYTIVEQGAFKLKGDSIILAQLLFFIFILVAIFNLVLVDDKLELIVTSASTIVTVGFGLLLLRSAKKEAGQREQIEKLASSLAKANTKLQQMDKLKSEFVSIASHQLRSPITAISGYASLLREGSYGEITNKMREPIERIEQSARMMAISIEDYLNVSRIEAGNMKYNLTDFNLAEQAEHICDDLRPEALKRGLVLLFRKRVESKAIVNADIGKVQQIIHNLINNAIKYTPKGAITVYVHEDLKNKKIYVDFLDTGIGMNEETLHSIFQKFERADNANTVNVKGTGLGLYVAQRMAEAMNGTITAHSEGEGQGSRFTLELPLVM